MSSKPSLGLYNHPARIKAERAGHLTFDPGYPCLKGHKVHRYVTSLTCIECSRLRNEIAKERMEARK